MTNILLAVMQILALLVAGLMAVSSVIAANGDRWDEATFYAVWAFGLAWMGRPE